MCDPENAAKPAGQGSCHPAPGIRRLLLEPWNSRTQPWSRLLPLSRKSAVACVQIPRPPTPRGGEYWGHSQDSAVVTLIAMIYDREGTRNTVSKGERPMGCNVGTRLGLQSPLPGESHRIG